MGINWKRKLFHILFSLVLYLLCSYSEKFYFIIFLSHLLIFFLIWEFLRLKFPQIVPFSYLWAPLLKEKEFNKLSDATFYLMGILISAFLVSRKDLGYLILVLGIADPLAGIVGSLYGKKFLRFNKSLFGSLIFFLCTFFIGKLYLNYPFGILLVLGLFLSFVEFFSERDNFWVPFGGALFLKIIQALPK
ncbi:MAG: diacylglycerol/polyprenol kinase family protein [Caldimicrobium sp.]